MVGTPVLTRQTLCNAFTWGTKRALVWVLSANLIVQPIMAHAQTIPDPSIPATTPSMEKAPNGVPVVNIATPSAQGVSHNRFKELNINPEGMVFNNSKSFGTSQLGGVLLANPHLKNSGTARIIVNEVTGSKTSDLKGFAEVFGDRAQFVVANPNGITCDGCGFINTGRTTLTTGRPDVSAGELRGLDVDGSGVLAIEGAGLNAEDAPALDLLARTVRLNAPVNARDLKIMAGRNLEDYGARVVTPKGDDGSSKPALAIDGTHFGAMYANRISVIATEDGVGVRMPENMATGLGDLEITAAGDIEVTKASSAGNLTLTSNGHDVAVKETVTSAKDLAISGKDVVNQGEVVAGIGPDGTVTGQATLAVSAQGDLTNSGKILAASDITLESASGAIINTDGASLQTEGAATLTAADRIDNAGRIQAGEIAVLDAKTIKNGNTPGQPADIKAEGALTLKTDTLDNADGRVTSAKEIAVEGKTAGATLSIKGGKIASARSVQIAADAVDTSAMIEAQTDVSVLARTGALTQSGKIQAGGQATLTADSGTLSNEGTIAAVGTITVAASSVTNKTSGLIDGGQDVLVKAPVQIANSGAISAQNDLRLQTDIVENDEGALLAVGSMTVSKADGSASTRIANRSGVMETLNGDISLKANEFINERKNFSVLPRQLTYSQLETTVISVSDVAPGVSRQYLEYNASGTLFFRHPDDPTWLLYYDYGPILVRQFKDVATSTSAAAHLSSGGALTIEANSLRNAYSHIASAKDMTLSGGSLQNVGHILTKQTTIYKSGGPYDRCQSNKGCPWLVDDANEAEISNVAYDTVKSTIQAGGTFSGSFTGQVDNKTILGGVAPGELISANSVLSDVKEAPPQTDISLVDFFATLPAKEALTQVASPTAKALYETRSEFSNPSVVLGGDYFLSRVGLDTNKIPDRFAFNQALEERVVQNAILAKTGKQWLDPSVQDASQQLKYLIDNGIAAQDDLQLTVGVALTPAQIARLNKDMIWYVEETINGERVLAPRLYLASAQSAEFAQNGGSIIAKSVALRGKGIENSGDIVATNGAVVLTADQDIVVISGRVAATQDVALRAGGLVAVATDATQVSTSNGGTQTRLGRRAQVEAGGSLALEAGGSLAVLGADLRAGKDVTASAGQGLVIGGVTVEERVNVGDGDTYDRWSRTSHRGSTIEAGGSISTLSLGDTLIQGSKLRAGEDVDITALGGVTIEAARDTYDSSMQRNGGKKAGTSHSVHNVRSEIEAGNHIAVTSLNGDVTAQAVKFAANKPGDGTVALTAQQGQVALTSVTDEESWTYKSSSSNIATYKMRNAGAVDTTVAMTEVDADGGLVVKAGKGVVVEYRDAGSLEASLATLSATPGLEWMETLAKRDDVAWKAVQEAHDHWDYKSQGLSAPAAAIIAIAVSIATANAGFGSMIAGATVGTTEAAMATTAYAVVQASSTGALSAIASQAAVSILNNQGDIGKVLKELGSSESIRSLLVTMAVSGVTAGIGTNSAFKDLLPKGDAFADRVMRQAITQGVRASVGTIFQSTVGGQSFTEALKSNILSATLSVVSSEVFKGIGDLAEKNNLNLEEGDIRKVLMHAVAGCALGQVGSQNCVAGAIGAGLQEALGDTINDLSKDPQRRVQYSGLIAAVATMLAGGDASAVNAANQIAQDARTYNRQLHVKEIAAIKEKAKALADANSDGVLSAAEQDAANQWEERLGKEALRTVDGYWNGALDEDEDAAKILGEMAKANPSFDVTEGGQAIGFLKRDAFYDNRALYTNYIRQNAGFYDKALKNWVPDILKGKLSPSTLAVIENLAYAGGKSIAPEDKGASDAANQDHAAPIILGAQSDLDAALAELDAAIEKAETNARNPSLSRNEQLEAWDLSQALRSEANTFTYARMSLFQDWGESFSDGRGRAIGKYITNTADGIASLATDIVLGVVPDERGGQARDALLERAEGFLTVLGHPGLVIDHFRDGYARADELEAMGRFIEAQEIRTTLGIELVESVSGAVGAVKGAAKLAATVSKNVTKLKAVAKDRHIDPDNQVVRERVLANIEEGRKAREASNFSEHIEAEKRVQREIAERNKENPSGNTQTETAGGNAGGSGADVGATAGIPVVDQAATGIVWGKGIEGQGMPFEDYVASQLPAGTRLPPNFKTFDFFDEETGVATSVKTLDTTTAAKVANPRQVYSSLKGNVDTVANFSEASLSGTPLSAAQINVRELRVAIPANTTPAQWSEISKAIQYGQSRDVTVKITVVK